MHGMPRYEQRSTIPANSRSGCVPKLNSATARVAGWPDVRTASLRFHEAGARTSSCPQLPAGGVEGVGEPVQLYVANASVEDVGVGTGRGMLRSLISKSRAAVWIRLLARNAVAAAVTALWSPGSFVATINSFTFDNPPTIVRPLAASRSLKGPMVVVALGMTSKRVRETLRMNVGCGLRSVAAGGSMLGIASVTFVVPAPGSAANPTVRKPRSSGSPGELNAKEPGCERERANAPVAGMAPESNVVSSATIERSTPVSLSNTTVCPATSVTVDGTKPVGVILTWTAGRVGCVSAALAGVAEIVPVIS